MSAEPLVIERLVAGGRGLARQDSLVTLVRGGIPGERITITGTHRHRGYQTADLLSVVEGVSERIHPPCPVYGQCGGCQLQHIRYDSQVHFKQEMMLDTLRRIGKISLDHVADPIPSPQPFHYRSRIRFGIDSSSRGLGFRREGTHQFVEAGDCSLAVSPLMPVIHFLREQLAHPTKRRMPFHQVELRHSLASGSSLLLFRGARLRREPVKVLCEPFLRLPGITGVVISESLPGQRTHTNSFRWVLGEPYLAESFHDLAFRISDRSFMQAHWTMYETIGRTVTVWAQPEKGMRVLELYAGIGCLGLTLARKGALVTLVEANPHALRDARKAAASNHIGRCRFRLGTAADFLSEVEPGAYDLVLLDPPRVGLSNSCVAALVAVRVPRILYLSCDAPSLARDVARLLKEGYRITRLQAFDLFPQTAHLEILVELAL